MRLIFLGDISVGQPIQSPGEVLSRFNEADLILANLEGPILSVNEIQQLCSKKCMPQYNTADALSIFKAFNIKAAGLANNHIGDYPIPIRNTKEALKAAGVHSFGAGANLNEAGQPFVFPGDNEDIKIYAFGWDIIGCQAATSSTEGVNPLTPQHTLDTIRRLRAIDSSSFVIFVMHWNFELEFYPQPAQRQMAHDLISEGVDAVVGHHGHVVQGAELVDGKPIIYGLGNWFFPSRQTRHFDLRFPPLASRQLALELDIEGRRVRNVLFHWHQFKQETNEISFDKTEDWEGAILRRLTPFAGMGAAEYAGWFKSNRIRRRGLPVYVDYRHTRRNQMKDSWVKLRNQLVELLMLLKLRSGPSFKIGRKCAASRALMDKW